MFQLSIGNQNISRPMSYREGLIWQGILAAIFPDEVIWLKRVTSAEYWQQVDTLMVFPTKEVDQVTI